MSVDAIIIPTDEGAATRADETANDESTEIATDDSAAQPEREFDAQIDFNWHEGHSSLWWTLRALDGAQNVGDIHVVSDDAPAMRDFLEREIAEFPRAQLHLFEAEAESKTKGSKPNVAVSAREPLERIRPFLTRPAFGCTASTPAATSADYDQFIARFEASQGDGALAFVPREALEQIIGAPDNPAFSPFVDDAWRFGYCAILSMPVLEGLLKWMIRVEEISAQIEMPQGQIKPSYGPFIKHGWKLSREIGWMFLWRAYKRQLSLPDVQKKASHLLDCRVRAIEVEAVRLALTTSHPQWKEQMPER